MNQSGHAGFASDEENKKASDIYIYLELKESEGIVIELTAQFYTLFGRHIETAIKDQLLAMGVQHAKVIARDFGALDFMVRARVKSAVDQARGVIS